MKNEKGQVAIFIALIFQVLFVFFAMVINVGLLVHQKINLQNSVDFAAYYAAMKQSENLNAIAHINYQIRQSWKLLLFRYHHLGMGGEVETHPFKSFPPPGEIRFEDDTKETQAATVFCTAYRPFDTFGSEDYCKKIPADVFNPLNVPKPAKSTELFSNFLLRGFGIPIINLTNTLSETATKGCQRLTGLNWYALARNIAAYKKDVANRKKTMYLVANGMSKATNDFLDLDGESVLDGVEKTLKKNLSPENRDSFKKNDLKMFNSMGANGCGFVNDDSPPNWLVETNIFPVFYYLDGDCNPDGATNKFLVRGINVKTDSEPLGPKNEQGYETVKEFLLNYVKEPDGSAPASKLYKSTLGFEKNPWCMSYVAVEAKTSPNIPFSPLGKITMTAKAYAKPFGGRIGPWYGSLWPASAPRSDKGKRIDDKVPDRVENVGDFPDLNDAKFVKNFQPNYSRYVGDQTGIRSQLTMSQFGKGIYAQAPISFSWLNQIIEEDLDDTASSGDILSWDKTANQAPPFRGFEIAAVAPDHFDLNYYSIEPDYYRNYFSHIERRKDLGKVIPRGDLGSRRKSEDEKLKKFSIKDQIELVKDDKKSFIDTREKLKYYVLDFAHLLNSWQGKSNEDYSVDDSRFGKCSNESQKGPIPDSEPYESAVPGNCRAGGRVGYSVKLVDGEYLKSNDLELGGLGQKGAIKNPPPF